MASNIFQPTDLADINARILQLNARSQRKWGKMTLPQMLEHCCLQLKIGLGALPEKPFEGPSIFRTAPGRWFILYPMPWPRGAGTPSQMNMDINGAPVTGFQEEKQALLDLIEKVQSKDQFSPHPLFGNMDRKDWGRVIWKHLDHHLRQFGH
jgi:hypothetical protein